MSPTPSSLDVEKQRTIQAGHILANPEPGEDIVISGLSGSYPDSLNVHEFRDNLYNKKDLISDDGRRWNMQHPEIPNRGGRLYEIEKFDAGFFGVSHKQAHTMDPMGRMLLEKTFEAIVDAGIHPSELRGTKTGVFVGSCFSEAEKTWFYEKLNPHGCAVTGCIRSMLANRISYWLGVDGPSYTVDTACSSSLFALEHAYRSIRMGQCNTAIVGGCNLCLHPYVTLQFARLGVLNMDGKCKCFDVSANGYTRAEAVVVVVLQKSKNARRVYCQLIHAKTNCDGYKEQGITYPSGAMQTQLLDEFYEECQVDPLSISYVEAHGTGTRVGDPEELAAIENIFCPEERKDTLMIGSVKSNIGHSEPASGLCSITKAILAMEAGYLIPNINFTTPRPEIKSLQEGRMQVVTDKKKWNGGYVAVSSFGFGGGNCHVLIKSNPKEKINQGLPSDDIPRLVYISGRTQEAVNTILNDISSKPLDSEAVGLLHEVFKYDIPAHNYRGFAVLDKNGLISRELEYYPYENKPLWFIFSGLGGQWFGMGAGLMKIPVFSGVIEKCQQILSAKGVNITDLLTKTDTSIFTKQSNVFTAIVSIQIALLELLKYVDLNPVAVLGYSIGEITCAYYDGCLTLEQALLSAYYLGQAADGCKNIGGIVSVDADQKKVQDWLASGLEIASINSEKNIFISGPANKIKEFIEILKQKNITHKEINVTLAYHSSHTNNIVSAAIKQLKSLVPKPKERSENWVSTVSHDKLCSAEFLSSVLSKPIYFEENYKNVPNNAVTLEISPVDILQKVLKRSEFDDSIPISILDINKNTSNHLLTAIGKLYKVGFNPRIERLYPKISFPVSRGTSMLSPLVKWDHTQDWFVTKFEVLDKIKTGERTIHIKLLDEEFAFVAGHVIDGRILFPATGYLQLVWETVGMVLGLVYSEISVVFENVKFLRATNLPKGARVLLIVMVQKVSGNFEIIEGGTTIVTGRIYVPEDIKKEVHELPIPVPEKKDYFVPLNSKDIYKELRLRGYNYSGLFRGLHSCDTTATIGQISWNSNWVAFMDTILQMQILQEDTRGLFVPTSIERLTIDAQKQKQIIESLPENGTIPAYVYKHFKTISCGGVQIRGLLASAIGRKKNLGVPVLETYKFIPNLIKKTNLTFEQSVRLLLHIILENVLSNKVKFTEVLEETLANPEDTSGLISPILIEALADLPLKQPEGTVLTNDQLKIEGITVSDKTLSTEQGCTIVVTSNILKRPQVLQTALNAVIKGGYIITRESLDLDLSEIDLSKVNLVADHKLQSERLILLSKILDKQIKTYIDLTDIENKFEWLPNLQNTLRTDQSPCLFIQGDELSGVIGFINCLRREPGTENVSCVFIMDKDAPKFDPNDEFYTAQLRKQMSMNILKNGAWGTYRHMLLEEIKSVECEHAYVNVTVRGDLSSLRWIEGSLSRNAELDCNQVLTHIYYSALNFRDIMTATGRIAPEVVARGRFEQECVQGLEFAGRLSNGKRVIGMVPHLATATLVAADPHLIWSIPDEWSLEEAVTIPVVYGTVLYAFVDQGRIKPGMSILIHSGTGGVGQAAINIALHYKCTVYTTVGTPEKREFIKKNWPQIKDNQIGNSRDTSFEQMVMSETNGRGVDLVLNSLAEEKLQASVRCLAKGGKFLEIGKFDLSKDNPLPLHMFEKEASFHGVMLDTFFTTANSFKQIINELLYQHIGEGAVKPIQRSVFKEDEIEDMFRFMASGKHMGKVLVKIRDEEPAKITSPSFRLVNALPRYYASNNGTYIVVGGLGGFGLELIDWLIIRGVRKLVITSRKGISTGYQAMRIKFWKSYGVEIFISTANVTTYDGCQELLEQASEIGPVEAIFNLAVVLRDAAFVNQTKEDFLISFGAKAVATKYLDELSRELCPDLKQFVIFSSVSCGRGNMGQTNYGMSNSVMERICEKRHAEGFPALAVQWGAIGDVGLVAELQEDHTELVIGGTLQQRISSCLLVLDQFLKQKEPLCSSMLVAEKRAGDGSASNIVDAVVNILGIRDIKTVSVHSSLAELGMDSIMAVEIKQTLERDFEVFLTPQDIRGMTFARLHEIAAERETNQTEGGAPRKDETATITEMAMHFVNRAIGDEENASKPIIVLPSKAVETTKQRVLLIPGIEGMASVLETLASHLTGHAIVLQSGFENRVPTIQEMAELFLTRALDNLPNIKSEGFTLVAYSYGATIALELARLLEARGAIGRIILVDGAPEMLRLMAKTTMVSDNENEFQNTLLQLLMGYILSTDVTSYLISISADILTWEGKLDNVLKHSPENLNINLLHYRKVCDAIYLRLKAIINYESTVGKLKSKIKLIKPRQQSVVMEDEDFGLGEFTSQPVEIVYVDGNHILIVENPETSEEINMVLTKDIPVGIDKKPVISKIETVKNEIQI